MPKKAILVVEDNPQIAEIVRAYLEREGLEVEVREDGQAGLEAFREGRFDLAILDVMLPVFDGYTLCREIRKTSDVPILMLSAREDPLDRIVGLEVGADDYVSKPFHPPELMIRVHGLLRRASKQTEGAPAAAARIQKGDLVMEPDNRRALFAGQSLQLTRTEFDLLLAFVTHPGQVLSREHIIERVWGLASLPEPRLVDTHLRNLRAKLRVVSPARDLIRSIRGVGYRFD